MGIGLSFIPKKAREAHKVCLQSLITVQHQLEVYIELIVNFCASSTKKVVHVIVSNLLWPQCNDLQCNDNVMTQRRLDTITFIRMNVNEL